MTDRRTEETRALVPVDRMTSRQVRLQTASDPLTFLTLVGGVVSSVLLGDLVMLTAVTTGVVGLVAAAPLLRPLRYRAQSRIARRASRDRSIRRRLEENKLIGELPPPLRERYVELKMHVRDVPGQVVGSAGSGVMGDIHTQLDELLASYLRMLVALNNIDRLVHRIDELQLYRQLEQLAIEAETASDRVREVKLSRRAILLKRRERLEQAKEHREIVVTQLAMVEDIVRLLQDASLMAHDPEALGQQLSELMEDVAAAEEAVSEVSFYDGSRSEEEQLAHFEARVAG